MAAGDFPDPLTPCRSTSPRGTKLETATDPSVSGGAFAKRECRFMTQPEKALHDEELSSHAGSVA
jgi:hypothetical protein